LLLVQQVRPSVRESFYDLSAEKQTSEDYVTCLRRCDTFPADYKDDYLERYEYNRERKIAIMALLGMMDPRRPSKDIEAKRRRNSDNCLGDKRDFSRKEPTKQNTYDKNKKDGYTATIVVKILVRDQARSKTTLRIHVPVVIIRFPRQHF